MSSIEHMQLHIAQRYIVRMLALALGRRTWFDRPSEASIVLTVFGEREGREDKIIEIIEIIIKILQNTVE